MSLFSARFTGIALASGSNVVRRFLFVLSLISCLGPLQGATLERLSLDDMIGKSTAIVRGRVTGSHTAFSGNVIYTHYQLAVTERWKGSNSSTVDFVVPGGTVGSTRQSCPGAPELSTGKDYMLFLWTSSKSGLTYVVGFTQGLFELPTNATSDSLAVRQESRERMLEPKTGQAVRDQRIEMRLRDLSARITSSLTGARQ
jgi:hypothetical protein